MEPFPIGAKVASKFDMFNIMFLIQMLFSFCQLSFIIWNPQLFFEKLDSISESCRKVEASLIVATYYIILFESAMQKKNFKNLRLQLDQLDLVFKKFYYNDHENDQKFYSQFVKKFGVNFTISIANTLIFVLLKYQEEEVTQFFLIFSIQFSLVKLKSFHIIFYVDLLNYYLVSLSDQLKKIIEFINLNESNLKNKKYNLHLNRQLKICKNYYTIVHDISSAINMTSGISMCSIVKMLHFLILVDAYWYDQK